MNITDRTEYMERPGLQKTEDGSQMSGNTKKKPVLQGNQSKKEVSGKYTDVAEQIGRASCRERVSSAV